MSIEINKLANWFRANKMALNVSKTKFIIFHTKGKKFNFEENSIVYNENEIGKPGDPNLIPPLKEYMTNTPKRIVEPTHFWVSILMKPSHFNSIQIFFTINCLKAFSALTEQKTFLMQNPLKWSTLPYSSQTSYTVSEPYPQRPNLMQPKQSH